MLTIGLTGPTGSGKTTALRVLERRGFTGIDCDRVYDGLLLTSDELRESLTAAFGTVFLPDGTLDRKALAARIFGDSGELRKLNAIVYPAVRGAVEERLRLCPEPGAVVDAVNLIPSGLGKLCDVTVAVTAPPQVRLRRIMARDGLDEERARARLSAQKPDSYYRRHCAFLLSNESESAAQFERLADEFFDTLLSMQSKG